MKFALHCSHATDFDYGDEIMEPKYVYLIVGLVLLVVLALVAILRYQKSKVSFRGPGFGIDIEGQTNPEQPQQTMQGKPSSATTKIGGNVSGSKVTNIAHEGNAELDIGKDVKESDLRNEN
jgi:hypothetical protein